MLAAIEGQKPFLALIAACFNSALTFGNITSLDSVIAWLLASNYESLNQIIKELGMDGLKISETPLAIDLASRPTTESDYETFCSQLSCTIEWNPDLFMHVILHLSKQHLFKSLHR